MRAKKQTKSNCPITGSPQRRAEAKRATDEIAGNFPKGIAQPALRALVGAGLTTLDRCAKLREAELAALHGIGPKAVTLIRAALKKRGLSFVS